MHFEACRKGAAACPDAGNPQNWPELQWSMPRYFFHLYNGLATTDEEGRELPDAGSARRAAEREAREMAAQSVQSHGHLDLAHYVEVTDERGQVVARVRFGEAVTVTSADPGPDGRITTNLDQ